MATSLSVIFTVELCSFSDCAFVDPSESGAPEANCIDHHFDKMEMDAKLVAMLSVNARHSKNHRKALGERHPKPQILEALVVKDERGALIQPH